MILSCNVVQQRNKATSAPTIRWLARWHNGARLTFHQDSEEAAVASAQHLVEASCGLASVKTFVVHWSTYRWHEARNGMQCRALEPSVGAKALQPLHNAAAQWDVCARVVLVCCQPPASGVWNSRGVDGSAWKLLMHPAATRTPLAAPSSAPCQSRPANRSLRNQAHITAHLCCSACSAVGRCASSRLSREATKSRASAAGNGKSGRVRSRAEHAMRRRYASVQ